MAGRVYTLEDLVRHLMRAVDPASFGEQHVGSRGLVCTECVAVNITFRRSGFSWSYSMSFLTPERRFI